MQALAVVPWADGGTLHYFTTGNTHDQASISLIDRELTNRLNRELGIDFKLPPDRKPLACQSERSSDVCYLAVCPTCS